MRTDNANNYKLIKSCFTAYCESKGYTPYINAVEYEHDGFSCSAEHNGDTLNFRAIDACCPYCEHGGVDYCFNCGRHNQIDFEEMG